MSTKMKQLHEGNIQPAKCYVMHKIRASNKTLGHRCMLISISLPNGYLGRWMSVTKSPTLSPANTQGIDKQYTTCYSTYWTRKISEMWRMQLILTRSRRFNNPLIKRLNCVMETLGTIDFNISSPSDITHMLCLYIEWSIKNPPPPPITEVPINRKS